jgi:hypothetical protein
MIGPPPTYHSAGVQMCLASQDAERHTLNHHTLVFYDSPGMLAGCFRFTGPDPGIPKLLE